jgi:hypothetical protein
MLERANSKKPTFFLLVSLCVSIHLTQHRKNRKKRKRKGRSNTVFDPAVIPDPGLREP